MDRQQGGFFPFIPGLGNLFGGPGGFPGQGQGGFPGQGQGGFPGQGQGGFPGQGPGGFPGQGPGGFPGQGPGGGQQTAQFPPPPSNYPQFGPQSAGGPAVYAVDPGALYGCLYRLTRVRLENGRSFWFYPTFIGRTSVAGFRWRPRQQRWVYFGIDTNRIDRFQC
ncbi:hypothetical protein [Thalassobacillus hwangdonensis]|uniref:Transporter n=1 Tax=Thalassobacillus hwangdonensis TaxID=546108 RepID=A0ABW3KXN3_9BACI